MYLKNLILAFFLSVVSTMLYALPGSLEVVDSHDNLNISSNASSLWEARHYATLINKPAYSLDVMDNRYQKLFASDGEENDFFGTVAISGSRMVVGAYGEDDFRGSAYVYEKRQNNQWVEVAKLTARDRAVGDRFGRSVAISEDTIVVGSKRDHYGRNSGAAYVFQRKKSGVWTQTKLTAIDGAEGDHFGSTLAVSGDTIVIGAYQDDVNGSFVSGSVYVFEREGSGLWHQTKLTATDGVKGDQFGVSVDISDDTIIVGANGDDDNGLNSGSAYVFQKNDSGLWVEKKLTADDGAAGDLFGHSVAISGDVIVIGAIKDDDNGFDSGSVYVFHRSTSGLWDQTKLVAKDGASFDYFGISIDTYGGKVVIGAHAEDGNGEASGSAYIFQKNEKGLWNQTKLIAKDGSANDIFGLNIAVSYGTVVIGARNDDDLGSNSGSAYIYNINTVNNLNITDKEHKCLPAFYEDHADEVYVGDACAHYTVSLEGG